MKQVGDVESCVEAVLERVGKRILLATPLAIGKPNHLLNAFYRRAKQDSTIELRIYTALTLERPKGQSELERRFLGPFVERLWGDHPDLEYELDRVAGTLPENVRICEFYFYAGKMLGNTRAQRDYISTNYTFVARDLLARGVNVLAQQVSRGEVDGRPMLSLSSNPDVTPDLLRGLARSDRPCAVVAQVNQQLPFMYGDAVVPEETFDFVVDDPKQYYRLFPTPKTAVTDAEHMIGLYASTLVRDGGSLQIGIGAIGDALAYALKLRHEHNQVYRDALTRLRVLERFGDVIARVGGLAPFERGLFAPTEMLVDGFMHLIQAGIVKRKVYDDLPLQRLIDAGRIADQVTASTLSCLLEAGAIDPVLDGEGLEYLQRWGVLRADVRLEDRELVLPSGARVSADLRDRTSFDAICAHGLGAHLLHGRIVHAGFFLGPHSFYDWLRNLPEELRRAIDMRPVTRINQLYGQEELARLQRRHARFVNTGMMATLLGAVVSDGLDSGQVVSGVGGQYNFVAMAHALEDGRSILQVRATRPLRGETASNVVYGYGHNTIARHLRDLLVTEHGIAELRGKTDEEVVRAMLAVADSAFQGELADQAKREGKLDPGFELDAMHRENHAESYEAVLRDLRKRGFFPAFPFGTELTAEELELGRALRALKQRMASVAGEVAALTAAATHGTPDEDVRPLLERMGLAEPEGVEQTLYARLLSAELRRQRALPPM